MIYQLYFALIMAGFMAPSLLFGGYMMHYGGARESDLGFIFMIMPVTIFLRPLICAHADRYQLHKQMLAGFALLTSLAYLPYIALPLLLERQLELPVGARFWVLVGAHLAGSVGFCGVRSLGDALAVNYAKQVGSAYARYRKWGAISFGLCGYLLGFVNQNSRWLPDFVPCFVVYSASMATLALLVHLWPDEYFKIKRQAAAAAADQQQQATRWPSSAEIAARMGHKLVRLVSLRCLSSDGPHAPPSLSYRASVDKQQQQQVTTSSSSRRATLTVRQQLQIFLLLVRRDFRIGLYLAAILYGGLVGYSGPNFVFTWMGGYCAERRLCDASQLAGLVMVAYCSVETLCYVAIDRLRAHLNRPLMLELTFLSLMGHYYFYGLVLESVSPYWFLVESLHGVEYSISLATSVELGYLFGNEVELIMDELVERGIVAPLDEGEGEGGGDGDADGDAQRNHHELVKVSLMATMSGCFTLCYDGFGCILGVLTFGLVIARHSFVTCWLVVGSLAALGLAALLCVHLAGSWLGVRPRILELRDKQRRLAAAA